MSAGGAVHVPVEIRAAEPDDAAGIVAILNPIIEARVFTALDTPFSADEERQFIERFPAAGIFHVALSHGRIVGFQNVEPFATYTRAFAHVGVIGTYVDLALRRQGIGGRLFAATFAEASVKGYRKLFAFVRADNRAGLAAYQRHGFELIGTARKHARIDGHYIDELMIERWLEPHETA